MATPKPTENMENPEDPAGVPGTVHLVDLNHNLNARHAGKGDIVLNPTPSNDPNDPLNWTPRRKLLALVCQNV